MSRSRSAILAAMLFALLSATASPAAQPAPAGKDGHSAMAGKPSPAQTFAAKSRMINLFEIEAAQLALKRARDGNVRQFAEQMIKDHREAADKLQAALGRSNLNLPEVKLDNTHRQKIEKLRNAGTDEFDRSYMKMQIEGHRQALKLHQDYAKTGDLPALKETAKDLAQIIERHLTRAKEVETMIAAADIKDQGGRPAKVTALA